MSTKALKLSINQLIENENDEVVLKAIKDVVRSIISIKKKQIVGYDIEGEPISGEQLEKRVLSASEKVRQGKGISHNDLLEQMKNW